MGRWECEVVSAAHGPEDDHTKGDLGHVDHLRNRNGPRLHPLLMGEGKAWNTSWFWFCFCFVFFSFLEKSHQCIKTLVCDIVKAPTILILVSGDNNLWKLHKAGAE